MSRLRHSPAASGPLRLSAFGVSVAIHGVALGAIAAFSAARPHEERHAEVAAEFVFAAPEIPEVRAVPAAVVDDVPRPEAAADATESPDLPNPMDVPPESVCDETEFTPREMTIAVASRFDRRNVRFGPRRLPPGTGDGPPRDPGRRDGGAGLPTVAAASQQTAAPALPPVERRAERVAARIVGTVPPEYPERAREQGVEGRVVLVVEILADGSVGDVEVAASSGSAILDGAAADCVRRRWRFEPAREAGVAVRSRVRLPAIRFRIER